MNPRPLTLADRPLITEYLQRFPPEISELTFTNLYAWRQSRPILFAVADESLLFFTQGSAGLRLFGPPAGTLSLSGVFTSLGDQLRGADRFPQDRLTALPLPPGLICVEDRANADYVYRREDLATLAGRRFTQKRNHIKQCLAAHACEYESMTAATALECLDMLDRWCAARNCSTEPGLCSEYQAIHETLRHFEAFALIGGIIRIAGTIEAFAVGESLNPSTAVCHFEKAMPQFHGLSQLINHWFAGNSLASFSLINREQDLGIPGLRRAKESYHPDHLIVKVRIDRQ